MVDSSKLVPNKTRVRITSLIGNTQWPVGTAATFVGFTTSVYSHPVPPNTAVNLKNAAGQIQPWFIQDIELAVATKAEIVAERDAAVAKVELSEAKLKYLDEIQSEEFDHLEYQAYAALQIAEDTKRPKLERAKALAALIRDNKW